MSITADRYRNEIQQEKILQETFTRLSDYFSRGFQANRFESLHDMTRSIIGNLFSHKHNRPSYILSGAKTMEALAILEKAIYEWEKLADYSECPKPMKMTFREADALIRMYGFTRAYIFSFEDLSDYIKCYSKYGRAWQVEMQLAGRE